MTCEQAELRMAELLAGEIAAEERSALEKHLLDCASCRGDFELARTGARIEWADVPVPQKVVEATLASFREPAPVVRFFRWATAAAAAFGVAALLLTSSRAGTTAAPVAAAAPVAERPTVLATMQDAAVGALVAKDEEGRPVGELSLKSHDVTVEILDGVAKTTVEENFENHTNRRLEGTFHFPLPSDASISRLALEVNGKIEEGTCLERERAREVFEAIVRKAMDPALLEWQPGGFFKCRVFPIEPRSTKRVIIAYTQALPCFQGKMTYVYPLASEKTRTHPPGEASITVQARFQGGLSKIESPSHHLDVQRKNGNEASMAFRAANYRPNNDFVVTMEPGDEEVRVVSHKVDGDDGYFACFAVPRGGGARAPGRYAFVIDASASTSAPRLEVAKRLVRAMMERRIDGDRFELIAHNIGVERSGEVDLRAANTFMDRLQPIGGSDVLQALLAAGDAEAIYIGKGAATFGQTDTAKILDGVKGRRIRTIAVGSDANGTLLERLGGMMRVSPNDDVTKRVVEIAATLGAPVLSDLKIDGGDAVYDVVGVRDLFYGERLIVSGRYRGPAAKLVITGRGYRREVDVAFPAKEDGNNYVRRLWAQRRVSDLLAQGPATKAEVTDLGVKYQIMTPYTSFLVLETEQMWKDFQLKREVQKQDEVLGKKMAEAEEASAEDKAAKIEVTRKMAQLLEECYAAADQRRFDRVIQLSGELLKIDPHYVVAKELKEDAEKSRHKEEYSGVWSRKLDELKRQTDGAGEPRIPRQNTVRFLSMSEWKETQKRLSLLPAEGLTVNPSPAEKKPELKPQPNPVLVKEPPSPPPTVPLPVEPVKPLPPRDPEVTRKQMETLEDSKARAIREAYEEQLRRDRQEVTLNFKNAELEKTVDEFRRQSGWNVIVDRERSGEDIPQAFWMDNGERPKWREEYLSVSALQKFPFAGQAAPSNGDWSHLGWAARSADDWDGYLILPTAGSDGKPMKGGDRNGVDHGVALRDMEVENQRAFMTILNERIGQLDTENSQKAARINDLQRALDRTKTLATKEEADQEVFKRLLEVQEAQIQELTTKVDESRAKLAKSLNEKSLSVAESEYSRLQIERLRRDKRELEDKLNAIAQVGGNVNVAPKKALESKVTAVANDLVFISMGKDDGILEGDEFTVYRGGVFVAKVMIDRSDRKWSAGKIVLKKAEPRVGDDVSNHILSPDPRTGGKLRIDAATADGSWIAIKPLSAALARGQVYAVTREQKFVALIQVTRDSEARVFNGIAAGRILPGDDVVFVGDPRAYFQALPAEVRQDLASRANQHTIRAKMGLKE